MPETEAEKAAREARESSGGRGPTDEGRGVARKLLNRFRGRAEDAIAHMADENKDLREERRGLRDKVAKFEAPGTVVLTADDAKQYTELKALGKTPAELKKAMDELPALQTKVIEHDRRTAADEAAKLLGWNPAALSEVAADKKLDISFEVATVDGKQVRVAHVKPSADDKAKAVPLKDYATQHLSTYLPALSAKANGAAPAAGTTGRTATPYVEQGASSSTAQNGDGTAKPRQPASAGNYKTPGQLAATKQNATT